MSPVRTFSFANCSPFIAFARACRLSATTLLLMLVVTAATTFAQTTGSATLRGVIKDPNGAIVPNATVTLVDEATNQERTTNASDNGSYVFSAVQPGTYNLRATSTGFSTANITGLVVSPSEIKSQDVDLAIGAETVVVDVQADSDQLVTETGERNNTITAGQIESLTLIGRNPVELLKTLPGVVAPRQEGLESTGFISGANSTNGYNVNGQRGENNNVQIDGSRLADIGSNNGAIITPNNDMISELTIKSSNYLAESGSSGVQIIAVTKGGGNDFHGSLYYQNRDPRFNSNDRSANYANIRERGRSKYNYPGGNLGGPIILPRFGEGGPRLYNGKDKLFFFIGIERQFQDIQFPVSRSIVPTLAQRRGDFSENLSNLGQSQIGTIFVPGTRNLEFAGAGPNVQTQNLAPFATPLGIALLNRYPLPNADGSQGFNYFAQPIASNNRLDTKARFDYVVNDSTRLYLRLARESEASNSPYGLYWNSSSFELPSPVLGNNLGRSAALNITSILNPTATNEVVFSGSKLKLDSDYADRTLFDRDTSGAGNFLLPFDSARFGGRQSSLLPYIGDFGSLSSQTGFRNAFEVFGGLAALSYNDSFAITDNFTKIAGAHTLKFGGLIEQVNKKQNTNANPEGLIAPAGNAGWGAGTTGSDFGDILVGQPAQVTSSTAVPIGNFRYYNLELYAQDSYKARSNLVLEYGVRTSYFPQNQERKGLATAFDPNSYVRGGGQFLDGDPTRPNGYLLASRGEIPKGIIDNPAILFAPRLGFAYDISKKGNTVVRGGAGLFFNRVQGNFQYYILTQPPNSLSTTYNSYNVVGPTRASQLTYDNLGQLNPLTNLSGFSPATLTNDSTDVPRTASYSFSIQQRLPFKNVLEVAYVGSAGRHLPQRRNIDNLEDGAFVGTFVGPTGTVNLSDPLVRAALSPGDVAFANRFDRFPDFGNVLQFEFTGTSSYNSLQATLQRQFSNKFGYYATYTFSKTLGTTATNETGGLLPALDVRGRGYGRLDFDRPHIFNVSFNYDLPNLARGAFENRVTRALFNGFQTSGFFTYQSGEPLRPFLQGDGIDLAAAGRAYFGSTSTALQPVYLSDPRTGNSRVDEVVLDGNAIGVPAFGQTGSFQSPFDLRFPSRNFSDLTVYKDFRVSESKKFQFRVGAFNVFNQASAYGGQINTNLNVASLTPRNASGQFVYSSGANAGQPVLIANGTSAGLVNTFDARDGFRITNLGAGNNQFGRITSKFGRRIIEFVVRFDF